MNYGRIPRAGGGVFALAVIANQLWLAAIAVGIMVILTVALRLGWRRGRRVGER